MMFHQPVSKQVRLSRRWSAIRFSFSRRAVYFQQRPMQTQGADWTVGRAPRHATSVGSSILIQMIPGIFFAIQVWIAVLGVDPMGPKNRMLCLYPPVIKHCLLECAPFASTNFPLKHNLWGIFQLATFELSIFNNFHHRYHRPLSTIHYHHWRFFSPINKSSTNQPSTIIYNVVPPKLCLLLYIYIIYKPH